VVLLVCEWGFLDEKHPKSRVQFVRREMRGRTQGRKIAHRVGEENATQSLPCAVSLTPSSFLGGQARWLLCLLFFSTALHEVSKESTKQVPR
jgi:hypothetical protein